MTCSGLHFWTHSCLQSFRFWPTCLWSAFLLSYFWLVHPCGWSYAWTNIPEIFCPISMTKRCWFLINFLDSNSLLSAPHYCCNRLIRDGAGLLQGWPTCFDKTDDWGTILLGQLRDIYTSKLVKLDTGGFSCCSEFKNVMRHKNLILRIISNFISTLLVRNQVQHITNSEYKIV